MLDFNYKVELNHYTEKYNSNNVTNDIDNIEKLEKNDEYLKPYLIKNNITDYKSFWTHRETQQLLNSSFLKHL